MNKKLFLGIVVTLIVLLSIWIIWMYQFTGYSVKETDTSTPIRIGYKASANYLPLFVAIEKGYFKEQGINVELTRFDSTNLLMESFAAGKLDATPSGNVMTSYALENKYPGLFMIYNVDFFTNNRHPENFVVRKGSNILEYKDLEGKKIGLNQGLFAKTMLKIFLEKQQVKNVQIIELKDEVQLQALESGQIDALISLEPIPTITVEKGIAEYLQGGSVYAKTTDFSPGFSAGVISTKFLEDHPEEAKKFLAAMEKSIDFIDTNFDESMSILPKYTPIEPEIANKITISEIYFVRDLTSEQKQRIQKTADFLTKEGVINKIDTGKLLLDPKFYP